MRLAIIDANLTVFENYQKLEILKVFEKNLVILNVSIGGKKCEIKGVQIFLQFDGFFDYFSNF